LQELAEIGAAALQTDLNLSDVFELEGGAQERAEESDASTSRAPETDALRGQEIDGCGRAANGDRANGIRMPLFSEQSVERAT
jgi:hypothetical protein